MEIKLLIFILWLYKSLYRVKKCTAEGRGSMSIDLDTLTRAVDNNIHTVMNRGEFVKGKEYVDAYIKAFYFTEEDLFMWIPKIMYNYDQEVILSIIRGSHGITGKSKKERRLMSEKIELLYKSIQPR